MLTSSRDILLHLESTLSATQKPTDGKRDAKFALFISKLYTLVEDTNSHQITLSQIHAKLFPKMAPESARTAFSAFRQQLKEDSSGDQRNFELVLPHRRNAEPEDVLCHFEGDAMGDKLIRKITAASIEPMFKVDTPTILRAISDTPRIFVSFAGQDNAKDEVRKFLEELRKRLRLRMPDREIKWWRFDEITEDSGLLVGDSNEKMIKENMARCSHGLLLLSPDYFDSSFIQRVELPRFIGPNAQAQAIPVAFNSYKPGIHIPPTLAEIWTHSLKGKPWSACQSKEKKDDFIESLIDHLSKVFNRSISPSDNRVKNYAQANYHAARGQFSGKYIHLKAQEEYRTQTESTEGSVEPSPSPVPSAGQGVPILDELLKWVRDPKSSAYLAILGETGSGKTTTCMQLAGRLLNETNTILPIYLDLRHVNEQGLLKTNRNPKLHEILSSLLQRTSSEIQPSPEDILNAVRERNALLIWDGLDEVLVHLGESECAAFIGQLLEALPPSHTSRPDAGRLLLSCRTQFFRNAAGEISLLTGQDREGLHVSARKGPTRKKQDNLPHPRARMEILRILPFNDQQIREYLKANVPGLDVERAVEVIYTIHDLQGLACQPYLLSLMGPELVTWDAQLSEGCRVRSVDIYQSFVDRWFARDQGKHIVSIHHKSRLMELLAAHLWREEARSIDVQRLETWVERVLLEDPVWSQSYGELFKSTEERQSLLEDFRTATLLGRWEGEAFRFSHTSLQEYFLARYLISALDEETIDAWTLPMPSRETIQFLEELWDLKKESGGAAIRRCEKSLFALLAQAKPLRSQLALRFWLQLASRNKDYPQPPQISLSNLNLEGSEFVGQGGKLSLAHADFVGTLLNQSRFENVNLTGALFRGTDLRGSEFDSCLLKSAVIEACKLDGAYLRCCDLDSISLQQNPGMLRTVRCRNLAILNTQNPSLLGQDLSRSEQSKGFSCQPQLGHMGSVRSCAWSPDGSRIASASSDNTLRIWDAASGQCLKQIWHLPEGAWAVVDPENSNAPWRPFIRTHGKAWRYFSWVQKIPGQFPRVYPAEAFGPLPDENGIIPAA